MVEQQQHDDSKKHHQDDECVKARTTSPNQLQGQQSQGGAILDQYKLLDSPQRQQKKQPQKKQQHERATASVLLEPFVAASASTTTTIEPLEESAMTPASDVAVHSPPPLKSKDKIKDDLEGSVEQPATRNNRQITDPGAHRVVGPEASPEDGTETDYTEGKDVTDTYPSALAAAAGDFDTSYTDNLLVVADIVDEDEIGRNAEHLFEEYKSNVASAQVVDTSKVRRRQMACGAVLVVLVAAAISVAIVVSRNNATSPEMVAPEPTDTPTAAPTTRAEGGYVFRSTEQLYEAVDAYLRFAGDLANESEIAQTYGYPMGTWNVSLVTNFSRVFDPARADGPFDPVAREMAGPITSSFNEDLSGWDTSRATSMFGMFASATSFEGKGLEQFNVANVEDFSYTFMHTLSMENADLSGWNTQSVTTTVGMFLYSDFDSDLSLWRTHNLTNARSMFANANRFRGGDLTMWDVSQLFNMKGMFSGQSFTGDISTWDTSSAENMANLFYKAESFNSDISSWNVSKVVKMKRLLLGTNFTGDVSRWDVSSVKDFGYVFSEMPFNGDLSSWNTSSATNFEGMLALNEYFDGFLGNWDTSRVDNFDGMFAYASSFTGRGLSNWDVSKARTMIATFLGAKRFNEDISSWNVSSLEMAAQLFLEASQFNRSLCPWNEKLPNEVITSKMFSFTSCTETSDPDLQVGGPFCVSCSSL